MPSLDLSHITSPAVVWTVCLLLLLVILAWTWRVHRRARALEQRLDELFGGMNDETTASMLAEYMSTVRQTASSVARMRSQHEEIVHLMPSVIRHVGLVRFSPFHDTGGDQSFTLALLDGRRDGVVITALHSRTDSRLYAKPIEAGSSPYALTGEEHEAMARALSSRDSATRATGT